MRVTLLRFGTLAPYFTEALTARSFSRTHFKGKVDPSQEAGHASGRQDSIRLLHK